MLSRQYIFLIILDLSTITISFLLHKSPYNIVQQYAYLDQTCDRHFGIFS